MRSPISALLVVSLLVAGCSSATPAPSAAIPAELAGYCTGTLSVATKYRSPAAGGGWEGIGATLPAGTTFVLAEDFSHYGGFAFLDGTPVELEGDFLKGLALGTDFASSCATKPERANADFVVLEKTVLFANKDLSGASCQLTRGTKFKSYSYSAGGSDTVEFGSSDLSAICGFAKGYASTFHYGALLRR